MAETGEVLMSARDQMYLVLALGGCVIGGVLMGAGTTLFARWWVERGDRDALRRTRK